MDHGCKDVRHWLASFQLQDFTQAFINNGFTSLRKCCHLTEGFLLQTNVPSISHALLLDASTKLRISFPDYSNHKPTVEDDTPPPLPEKKNRRSLPSPVAVTLRNHDNKIRKSLPFGGPPPSAPPRSSVLRKSIVPPLPHNTDKSAELHLLDLLPPPPPMHEILEPEIVVTSPPLSPPKYQPPGDKTLSEEFLQSMPKDCQSFLSNDQPVAVQPEQQSAYYDISLVADEAARSPSLQKKPKPPIKPRPSILPRPAIASPKPLRQSFSSTLPSSTGLDAAEERDRPKSATLPPPSPRVSFTRVQSHYQLIFYIQFYHCFRKPIYNLFQTSARHKVSALANRYDEKFESPFRFFLGLF